MSEKEKAAPKAEGKADNSWRQVSRTNRWKMGEAEPKWPPRRGGNKLGMVRYTTRVISFHVCTQVKLIYCLPCLVFFFFFLGCCSFRQRH